MPVFLCGTVNPLEEGKTVRGRRRSKKKKATKKREGGVTNRQMQNKSNKDRQKARRIQYPTDRP
jgi:hypothetical protein